MRILLAVDGSECGLRAARFVVELFAGREVQVEVVNVQATTPYGELLSGKTRARVEQWHQERGRLEAADSLQVLLRAGVSSALHVLAGEPARAIAAMAKERGCGLIVMGSRGLGAVSGAVLGSVAAKVIRLAEVPVTVVK